MIANLGNQDQIDNEIDLLELFQRLWKGKFIILIFIMASLTSGFLFVNIKNPLYEVSVSYFWDQYSVSNQQICGRNIGCLDNMSNETLLRFFDNEWPKEEKKIASLKKAKKSQSPRQKNFIIKTENPLDLNVYEDKFIEFNAVLVERYLQQAKIDLNVIDNELSGDFQSTEVAAGNIIVAKRIIKALEAGFPVISFSEPEIELVDKSALILALSSLLGGMLGVFFVLIRGFIKKDSYRTAV